MTFDQYLSVIMDFNETGTKVVHNNVRLWLGEKDGMKKKLKTLGFATNYIC